MRATILRLLSPDTPGETALLASSEYCAMDYKTALGRFIHRSAWKGNSRKFISKILHSPSPKGLETADSLGLIPNLQPYILWCCINMREVGCTVIGALL